MVAELLFWPALVAYGEAAVAFFGAARRPELGSRVAIWGVRVGWLAQTGLLAFQAVRAEGFPWTTWAVSLNLFAWLVVGAYLIWGCRPRFRLLGVAVMPLAVALLALAHVGGGTSARDDQGPGPLLALHATAMLAAFAGFTLAAALAAFFLWQERDLKRRDARILRFRVPPLEQLERLTGRTVTASFAALTAGIVLGLASFLADGGRFDAAMAVTFAAWIAFGVFLVLRRRGLRGPRAARVVVAGVLVVAVALPVTHFA